MMLKHCMPIFEKLTPRLLFVAASFAAAWVFELRAKYKKVKPVPSTSG